MCQCKIPWLPHIIELDSFGGNVITYIDHIYSIFCCDFLQNTPQFEGRCVKIDKRETDGKRECFLHITSSTDKESGNRNTDLRRCERVCWIKPTIENSEKKEVLVWEKRNKRDIRSFIFIPDEDFIIILTKSKYCFYLTTAIYLDYPNKKTRYLKDFEEYKKAKTA